MYVSMYICVYVYACMYIFVYICTYILHTYLYNSAWIVYKLMNVLLEYQLT